MTGKLLQAELRHLTNYKQGTWQLFRSIPCAGMGLTLTSVGLEGGPWISMRKGSQEVKKDSLKSLHSGEDQGKKCHWQVQKYAQDSASIFNLTSVISYLKKKKVQHTLILFQMSCKILGCYGIWSSWILRAAISTMLIICCKFYHRAGNSVRNNTRVMMTLTELSSAFD